MHQVAASSIGIITVVGIIRGLVAQPQCSMVDRGGIISVIVGITASVIVTVVQIVASTISINSNHVSVSCAGAGVYISVVVLPIKRRVVQVVLGRERRELGVGSRVAGGDAGRAGVSGVGTVSGRRGRASEEAFL